MCKTVGQYFVIQNTLVVEEEWPIIYLLYTRIYGDVSGSLTCVPMIIWVTFKACLYINEDCINYSIVIACVYELCCVKVITPLGLK